MHYKEKVRGTLYQKRANSTRVGEIMEVLRDLKGAKLSCHA